MFAKEDLQIDNLDEFIEFLPCFVFIGLVLPFIVAAYKVGAAIFFLGKIDEPTPTDYPRL